MRYKMYFNCGRNMVKKNSNYRGISVPKELIDEIEKIVHARKHGYRSINEVVKEALRNFLKDYNE